MKPVKFHPSAEIEMHEAAKYYELKTKDLGKRFLNEVQDAIRRIQINPRLYHKIYNDVRRCLTYFFPFGIIFREKAFQIEIIAVMHLKRKPNYWNNRTDV
jgi:toxin ParE1/3/4